jgi:hypothetical protein
VVGVFGVPAAHEDDPERASELAHDLSDRIFIAGGVEHGTYLFDAQGNFTAGNG